MIKILKENGWYLVRTRGDHYQFKHSDKKGTVTVTHPMKDLRINDLKNIERITGLKFK